MIPHPLINLFSFLDHQLIVVCMPESHYYIWDPLSTALQAQGCNYVGSGACYTDGTCPPCRVRAGHSECEGPNLYCQALSKSLCLRES